MMRSRKSGALPGGAGVMMRTDFAGYACARASDAKLTMASSAVAVMKSRVAIVERVGMMV